MSGFKSSCRIRVNADGDWQILPPASQITRVGTGGGGFVPGASNNDLLVTGQLGVYGTITGAGGVAAVGDTEVAGAVEFISYDWNCGGSVSMRLRSEEITIPVGSGAGFITSSSSMFQPNCMVLMVNARVTQAPGGGATTFKVKRTVATGDRLILDKPVAVDGTFNSTKDSDGTHDGPFYNGTISTCSIRCDANVTGSDMKIRVGVAYIQLWDFNS